MARQCSVVIVLLHDDLRPGTRGELLAVEDDSEVDLKVLWFPRRRRIWRRQSSVAEFLTTRQDKILYTCLPDANSEEAWVAVVRNLVATLLKALRSEDQEPYVEVR
jgi:hypothetical protein